VQEKRCQALRHAALAEGFDILQKTFRVKRFRVFRNLSKRSCIFLLSVNPLMASANSSSVPSLNRSISNVYSFRKIPLSQLFQHVVKRKLFPPFVVNEPLHNLIDDSIFSVGLSDLGIRVRILLANRLSLGS